MLKFLILVMIILGTIYFMFNNSSDKLIFNKNSGAVSLSEINNNQDLYNKKIVYTNGYPTSYFSILGSPYLLIKDRENNKALLKAINIYQITDSLVRFKVKVNSLVKVNDFGLLYLEEVK